MVVVEVWCGASVEAKAYGEISGARFYFFFSFHNMANDERYSVSINNRKRMNASRSMISNDNF